jgi:hypothetical protein
MPRGDRTGPEGAGPMTGRGLGYCSGYNAPGFMDSGFGRAFRRGFGCGRGFAFRARAMQFPFQQVELKPITKEQEKEYLEQGLKDLKEEIVEIQKRLKEINS